MIAYLKGKIQYKDINSIVLETGGVGYRVFIASKILEKAKQDKELELYVFHHQRDDAVELYGFESKNELDFFKQLFSVNGVGPKMALAIISDLKMEQAKQTIIQGDASLLQSVSGVGAKTAERIVLDLKNKVALDGGVGSSTGGSSGSYNDLIDALVGLGYSRHEAARLSQTVPADVDTIEEKIKYVLKNVSKNS